MRERKIFFQPLVGPVGFGTKPNRPRPPGPTVWVLFEGTLNNWVRIVLTGERLEPFNKWMILTIPGCWPHVKIFVNQNFFRPKNLLNQNFSTLWTPIIWDTTFFFIQILFIQFFGPKKFLDLIFMVQPGTILNSVSGLIAGLVAGFQHKFQHKHFV